MILFNKAVIMYEYEKVFRLFEEGLLEYGSKRMPRSDIQAQLDE